MKVISGENYVEFVPETDWEISQLDRLNHPRTNFTTTLIEAPDDNGYPPRMKSGAKLRINMPRT